MRVTASDLTEMHACDAQVKVFRATWPKGCTLTRRAILRAFDSGLDVRWEAVAPASRAYDEAVAPARRAYDEAVADVILALVEARRAA